MRQASALAGYFVVVVVLLVAAVFGDSAMAGASAFVLFLGASPVFAYAFLNYRKPADPESEWPEDVEPYSAGPSVG